MSPEGYEVHDARFIQVLTYVSAANALSRVLIPVPAGKVWNILGATYYPSVDETRTVFFNIFSASGYSFPVTVPVAIALSAGILLPMLTMGMEIRLYPGEYLEVRRDAATAGSTMTLSIRFIETDLPYYSYEEPLKKIIQKTQKHSIIYRSGGGGGAGGVPGGRPEGGGGGGGPKPI